MAFVRFIGKLGTNPAIRANLSQKNVHQIASSRVFSSTPVVSVAVQKPSAAKAPTPAIKKKDPLDTSFNDPIAAFKSKTTFELIRGYLVYLICSSETLVENNMKVWVGDKDPCYLVRIQRAFLMRIRYGKSFAINDTGSVSEMHI